MPAVTANVTVSVTASRDSECERAECERAAGEVEAGVSFTRRVIDVNMECWPYRFVCLRGDSQ